MMNILTDFAWHRLADRFVCSFSVHVYSVYFDLLAVTFWLNYMIVHVAFEWIERLNNTQIHIVLNIIAPHPLVPRMFKALPVFQILTLPLEVSHRSSLTDCKLSNPCNRWAIGDIVFCSSTLNTVLSRLRCPRACQLKERFVILDYFNTFSCL